MLNKNYVVLAFLVLAIPSVFAVSQGVGTLRNGQIDAAMADVNCKTAFNTGVIQSYISVLGPSADLSSYVDKLNSDTSTLSGYANSNDTSSFRSYLRDTYEKDSKDARSALNTARHAANLSNESRVSLRTQYDSLKSTYDSCHVDAVRSFALAKADAYD